MKANPAKRKTSTMQLTEIPIKEGLSQIASIIDHNKKSRQPVIK